MKGNLFKSVFLLLLICISLFLLSYIVSAHSGDTDANGGHYNYSTNEYHYHHGHPAHQHNNGNCPYEIEDTDFSEILSKIFIFIVGALAIPFFSIFIFGMIGMAFDEIISKFKKKDTDNNQESDEKSDKLYAPVVKILVIVELAIWLIIVINM